MSCCVFQKGLFHFPKCIVYLSEDSVTQNCTQFSRQQLNCKSTDRNGTMQRVRWHFTLLHQHLADFHKKKKRINYRDKTWSKEREVEEDIISAVWQIREGDKRDETLPAMSLVGKTNSCCCWPQQNSWGEAENSRHFSCWHSWTVILIVWLTHNITTTQKCVRGGEGGCCYRCLQPIYTCF